MLCINTHNIKAWIGGNCRPSDKGMLIAFPRFTIISINNKKYQHMLKYEELPEVNSKRWLSLEDFEGEIWKEVPNYDRYEVSNYGRVKSHAKYGGVSERILRQAVRKGYYYVLLANGEFGNTKSKSYGVHHVVAMAFIPNPNNLPFVNHKDEGRTNNMVENLEWCDMQYNLNYGTARKRAGVKHGETISIPVAQYSLDGKYMRTFKNFTEAENCLGFGIYKPRNGFDSKYSQSGGYMWRYCTNPDIDYTKDIEPYVPVSGDPKVVEQYTLDGDFVARYNSTTEASMKTGLNRQSIGCCALGKYKSSGGYLWKYIGNLKE